MMSSTVVSDFVAVISGLIDSFDTQSLCQGLPNNANATGEQPCDEVDNHGVVNSYAQWNVSVRSKYSVNLIEYAESTADGNDPNAIAKILLDPKEGADLNSGEVFSASAYLYKNLPLNTKLRQQGDDGRCEQMLPRVASK